MADPIRRIGSLEVVKGEDGKPLRWPSGRIKYRARVHHPDGTRMRKLVPESHCYSEVRAREYVAAIQEQLDAQEKAIRAEQAKLEPQGETVNEWVERYG